MNALMVDDWLSRLNSTTLLSTIPIDEHSKELVMELFELTSHLESVGEDNLKELWFTAEKPSYEEYRDSYYEEDEYTEEEIRNFYKEDYPDQIKWYKFQSVHHCDGGRTPVNEFFAVFVERNYILSINDINEQGFPIDVSDFVEWMIEQVQAIIAEIKQGAYNERIVKELPYRYRSGSVKRRDYWNIYPNLREEYRSEFKENEINEFLKYTDNAEEIAPGEYYKSITARQYYEACAIGCLAAGTQKESWKFKDTEEEHERYGGVTPKEMYYANADGRDDGMMNVPLDDAEAFEEWLDQKGLYFEFNGHHPWEIMYGRIHFGVRRDEEGFYFWLSGFDDHLTISIFLALKRASIPVVFHGYEDIENKLNETDELKIKPNFLDLTYEETVYLSDGDKEEELIAKVEWDDEKVVNLKGDYQ